MQVRRQGRSWFERLAAKLLDVTVRRLTPNTMFYFPDRNPFRFIEEKEHRSLAGSAAIHLACGAARLGATRLTVMISQITDDGRPFGDWRVIIEKVADEEDSADDD